jgi:hypothetical protein
MLVGDSVLVERGRTAGTIIEIIEDAVVLKQWHIEEPGVMIKSPQLGVVFLPVSSFFDDPVVFVGRNKI